MRQSICRCTIAALVLLFCQTTWAEKPSQDTCESALTKNQNNIALDVFGDYKIISRHADGVIVEMKTGLYLMRQKLIGKVYASIQLRGERVVKFDKRGEYFIIETEGKDRSGNSVFQIQFVHEKLSAISFIKSVDDLSQFRTLEMPDGLIFIFESELIILKESFKLSEISAVKSRLGYVAIGEIKDVKLVPFYNEDEPLIAVEFDGKSPSTLNRLDTDDRKRVAYFDSTLRTDTTQTPNFHLSLQKSIFDLSRKAELRWIAPKIQDPSEILFFVNTNSAFGGFIFELRKDQKSFAYLSKRIGSGTKNIDLSSVRLAEKKSSYWSANLKIDMSGSNVKTAKNSKVIVPDDSLYNSALLIEPKVIYRDKKGNKLIESEPIFKQGEESHRFAYTYVPVADAHRAFSFYSNYQIKQTSPNFPVEPDKRGRQSLRHSLLFAKLDEHEIQGYLIIDVFSGNILWVAGLNKISFDRERYGKRIEFWGEQKRDGKVVPLLSIYDASSEDFERGFDYEGAREEQFAQYDLKDTNGKRKLTSEEFKRRMKLLEEPDDVFVKIANVNSKPLLVGGYEGVFYKSIPAGVWSKPKDYSIESLPNFGLTLVHFSPKDRDPMLYAIESNQTKESKSILFGNVFEVNPYIDDSLKDQNILTIASQELQETEINTDGTFDVPWFASDQKKQSAKKPSHTFIRVYRRSKTKPTIVSQTKVMGRLVSLKLLRDGSKTYAIGTTQLPGLISETTSEFRWDLNDENPQNVLFEKVQTPIYTDNDFDIFISKRSSVSPPRVILQKKGFVIGSELELKYSFKEKLKKAASDDYFDFLFGAKNEGVELNHQDIATVKRDRDLLFVTTETSVDKPSLTFIFNLDTKEMILAIPNYREFIDVGKLRFYIGDPGQFHQSIVAVFNRTTHRFIRFFDLGELKLKPASKENITVVEDNILFKTENGSVRVFDTKENYFIGTLDKQLEDLLTEQTSGLGVILNQEIFRKADSGFYQRDEFITQLQSAFPMTPSKFGSRNLLLIAEDGVGRTSALESYFYRYITGQLQPTPQYKAIGLSLTPAMVKSGTMYRGTKADKYKNISDMSRLAANYGYRLILVIDDVTKFLPRNEVQHGDDEGDFFQAMTDILKSKTIDMIVTTSPSGAEFLQRREPEFFSEIKRTLRMEPLKLPQTQIAVKDFLTNDVQNPLALQAQQVESISQRLKYLNSQKMLPGSVFEVIKQVISEIQTSDAKPNFIITDDMIDSALAQKTGVPRLFLDRDHVEENMRDLAKYLKNRVKNVDEIIDELVIDLSAFILELNRPDWPILRYLAVGPTGTGKTELIVALTEYLFHRDSPRLHIPGETFKEPRTKELIALLVKHRREFPFNIIHFDEFDKMHPENQDIVLSLSDGRIVSETGEKLSSSLSLIYCTSNGGVTEVLSRVAGEKMRFNNDSNTGSPNGTKKDFLESARKGLRPEVYNRFDRYLVFPFLLRDVALAISETYLNGVEGSGIESISQRYAKKGTQIYFDQSVIEYAADHHVDFLLGARRLVINLENMVKNFIIPLRLTRELMPGDSLITISHNGRSLEVSSEKSSTLPLAQ